MEPEGSFTHSQVPNTCPYPEPHQSSPCPPHPTSWISIIILSTHLRLGLPSGLFPSGFPTKTLYTTHLTPIRATCPRPSHSCRFYHPDNIWWAVQIIKLLITEFSPLPCYFVPVRSKYSPQHPVLKHPRPKFLLQCEAPGFTPIQNSRQNYNSLYLA